MIEVHVDFIYCNAFDASFVRKQGSFVFCVVFGFQRMEI